MGTQIRHAAGMASCLVALAACAAAPSPAAPPPSAAPPSAAPGSDAGLCRAYAESSQSARAPLNAMRQEAVLAPFIDYIELGTHEVATRATTARDPAIVIAMREVVAAQDDIDAQGRRNLPPGADATKTTVRLDPERLARALDAADAACAPLLR